MSKVNISKSFVVPFLGIFIFSQLLTLVLTLYLLPQDIQLTIVDSNPNSIWNAVFLVAYIILVTALILVLSKIFKSGNYLFLIEALALFSGLFFVFSILLSRPLAFLCAFYLLVVKYVIKKDSTLSKWYNNLLLAVAIACASAILGLGLGILPVVVLLVLLAIYDIISVFYTKHMVTLANMIIKKKVSLIFVLPSKKREYRLGGGDIVMPGLLSVSLFAYLLPTHNLLFSVFGVVCVWLASLLGLSITFYILDKYKGKINALPALPIQVILMCIVVLCFV